MKAKRDHWDRVHLDKIVHKAVRQEGWTVQGLGPLRSDCSRGRKAERLDRIGGGQRRSRESQQVTLGNQGTY
jgi:hypothetical protein